jgi:hypothetical protein
VTVEEHELVQEIRLDGQGHGVQRDIAEAMALRTLGILKRTNICRKIACIPSSLLSDVPSDLESRRIPAYPLMKITSTSSGDSALFAGAIGVAAALRHLALSASDRAFSVSDETPGIATSGRESSPSSRRASAGARDPARGVPRK